MDMNALVVGILWLNRMIQRDKTTMMKNFVARHSNPKLYIVRCRGLFYFLCAPTYYHHLISWINFHSERRGFLFAGSMA